MKKNNKLNEEERTALIEYNDATQKAHENIAEKTYDRLKLTLTLRQIIFIIIVLSTIGRATSGRWWFDYKQGYQVRRLSEENNRQDTELNILQHKIGYKNESLLIYRGILENRPSLLERSRVEHKRRSEPFEFVNWSGPDQCVEAMFQLEAWESLQWVMRQPKWYSCLNTETYKSMMEFSQKLNAKDLQTAAKNEHGN